MGGFRRILHDNRSAGPLYAGSILASAGAAVCQTGLPVALRQFIDAVPIGRDVTRGGRVVMLWSGFFIGGALRALAGAPLNARLDERPTIGFRRTVFQKYARLSIPYWQREH